MSRQILFYGFVNLVLGIILFVSFTLYIPDIISSLNVDCTGEEILSCGGLLNIVKMVSILVSIVGLIQILYWVFFEREKKELQLTAQTSPGKFKVCPECNSTNDLSAKFCTECGHQLKK
ncbi:MAG: zinc-ribbon domain-containing protein [Thermoplasmata archaeon]